MNKQGKFKILSVILAIFMLIFLAYVQAEGEIDIGGSESSTTTTIISPYVSRTCDEKNVCVESITTGARYMPDSKGVLKPIDEVLKMNKVSDGKINVTFEGNNIYCELGKEISDSPTLTSASDNIKTSITGREYIHTCNLTDDRMIMYEECSSNLKISYEDDRLIVPYRDGYVGIDFYKTKTQGFNVTYEDSKVYYDLDYTSKEKSIGDTIEIDPEAQYYPNTTGSAGWYEGSGFFAPTWDNCNLNAYSSANLNTVSIDDSNTVSNTQAQGAGSLTSCHRYKLNISQTANLITNIDYIAKWEFTQGEAGGSTTNVTTYVGNTTGANWNQLAYTATPTSGTKYTHSGSISSSFSDYVNETGTDNHLYLSLFANGDGGSGQVAQVFELFYLNLNITYTSTPSLLNSTIVYPTNTTYTSHISRLNYTSTGAEYCWWNDGLTNSTPVSAGTNFTFPDYLSMEGSNTWTLYCNDSSNNLNYTSVTFNINNASSGQVIMEDNWEDGDYDVIDTTLTNGMNWTVSSGNVTVYTDASYCLEANNKCISFTGEGYATSQQRHNELDFTLVMNFSSREDAFENDVIFLYKNETNYYYYSATPTDGGLYRVLNNISTEIIPENQYQTYDNDLTDPQNFKIYVNRTGSSIDFKVDRDGWLNGLEYETSYSDTNTTALSTFADSGFIRIKQDQATLQRQFYFDWLKVYSGYINTTQPSQTDWWVATTGNDTNAGNESDPFLTIQHAIDVSSPGDNIYVVDGTYNETITFNDYEIYGRSGNWLNLESNTTHGSIISQVLDFLNVEYMSVSKFNFTNISGGDYGRVHINADNIIVDQNYFENIYTTSDVAANNVAILTEGGRRDNLTVSNNTITRCNMGIALVGHNIQMLNNDVSNSTRAGTGGVDGDYLRAQGHNITVRGNYLHGTSSANTEASHVDGFQFFGSTLPLTDFVFEDNILEDFYAQGLIFEGYFNANASGNITIRNNVFYDANSWGMLIEGIKNVTIAHNTFINTPAGVSIGIKDTRPAGTYYYNSTAYVYNNLFVNMSGTDPTPYGIGSWDGVTGSNSTILGAGGNWINRTRDVGLFSESYYDNDTWAVPDPLSDKDNLFGVDGILRTSDDGYTLSSTTEAIDNATTITQVTDDIFGNPRPIGAGYDPGAHEYSSPTFNISFVDPTPVSGITTPNTSIEFYYNITNITNGLYSASYTWDGYKFTPYDGDLMAYYNFNNISSLGENSSFAVDISRYSINLSRVGAGDMYDTGKYGLGASFNTTNYFSTSDVSEFGNLCDISILAWVYPKADNGGIASIYQATNDGRFLLFADSGRDYHFKVVNDTAEAQTDDSAHAITYDTWQMVTGTYNGTDISLYVDGDLKATKSWTGGCLNHTNSRDFKAGIYGAKGWNGTIDELKIWNKSLTQEEIFYEYQSNFKKYSITDYQFYINQSKNVTSLLDTGSYSYLGSVREIGEAEISTATRTITISPNSFSFTNTQTNESSSEINQQVNFSTDVSTGNPDLDDGWLTHNINFVEQETQYSTNKSSFVNIGLNEEYFQTFKFDNSGLINEVCIVAKNYSATSSDYLYVNLYEYDTNYSELTFKKQISYNYTYLSYGGIPDMTCKNISTPLSMNKDVTYILGFESSVSNGWRLYYDNGNNDNGQYAELNGDNFDFYPDLDFAFNITKGNFILTNSSLSSLAGASDSMSYILTPIYVKEDGYSYYFCANNTDGFSGCSSTTTLYIAELPDLVAPTGSLDLPLNGTKLNGDAVLRASASDNVGISYVNFQWKNSTSDWTNFTGCADTTEPYTCNWETESFYNSTEPYEVRIIPYDTSGNDNLYISTKYYYIDRSAPIIPETNVSYPSGQTSARDTQSLYLNSTASDSPNVFAGMNRVLLNLTLINGTSWVNMTFYDGDLADGEWSYWTLNPTISTSLTGTKYLEINAYDNATPTNNLEDSYFMEVELDNENPVLVSSSLLPENVYNNTNLTISGTFTDNYDLDRAVLYYNVSGIGGNETFNLTGTTNASSKEIEVNTTDLITWYWDIYDDAGNNLTQTQQTENVVDEEFNLTITLNDPADNNYTTEKYITFNYSLSGSAENNVSECSLFIDAVEYVSSTNISNQSNVLSYTLTPNGNYTWHIRCLDDLENYYTSEQREIQINYTELEHPVFSIVSPSDNAEYFLSDGFNILLYVNATDSSGMDSLWYSTNFDGNKTMVVDSSTATRITGKEYYNSPPRSYTITFCANNTAGNVNCTSISYDVIYAGDSGDAGGGGGGGGVVVEGEEILLDKINIKTEDRWIYNTEYYVEIEAISKDKSLLDLDEISGTLNNESVEIRRKSQGKYYFEGLINNKSLNSTEIKVRGKYGIKALTETKIIQLQEADKLDEVLEKTKQQVKIGLARISMFIQDNWIMITAFSVIILLGIIVLWVFSKE